LGVQIHSPSCPLALVAVMPVVYPPSPSLLGVLFSGVLARDRR
jgi:hypothetical protein